MPSELYKLLRLLLVYGTWVSNSLCISGVIEDAATAAASEVSASSPPKRELLKVPLAEHEPSTFDDIVLRID